MDYEKLLHAMQSGVAMMMNYNPKETEPKHLRVGINAALCDHAALVNLLINKGVISDKEYIQVITDEMADEVERYKKAIKIHLGTDKEINLG